MRGESISNKLLVGQGIKSYLWPLYSSCSAFAGKTTARMREKEKGEEDSQQWIEFPSRVFPLEGPATTGRQERKRGSRTRSRVPDRLLYHTYSCTPCRCPFFSLPAANNRQDEEPLLCADDLDGVRSLLVCSRHTFPGYVCGMGREKIFTFLHMSESTTCIRRTFVHFPRRRRTFCCFCYSFSCDWKKERGCHSHSRDLASSFDPLNIPLMHRHLLLFLGSKSVCACHQKQDPGNKCMQPQNLRWGESERRALTS